MFISSIAYAYADGLMLAKVNSINEQNNKVNVTLLDVDNLGSVIPGKDLELKLPPFDDSVLEFINAHEKVFVIEQNRDAQMRSLLVNELEIDPKKLPSILNYDGMPITAANIIRQILNSLSVSLQSMNN